MILTTHYTEEADRLCDRVAIMDQRKIVNEGRPENLKRGLKVCGLHLREPTLEDVFINLTGRGL